MEFGVSQGVVVNDGSTYALVLGSTAIHLPPLLSPFYTVLHQIKATKALIKWMHN